MECWIDKIIASDLVWTLMEVCVLRLPFRSQTDQFFHQRVEGGHHHRKDNFPGEGLRRRSLLWTKNRPRFIIHSSVHIWSMPTFLHQQVLGHPFWQRLLWACWAVGTQPHCTELISWPNHFCTWWLTVKQWCFTASWVGGNLVKLKIVLAVAFATNWYLESPRV